jgi:Terminase small subunit
MLDTGPLSSRAHPGTFSCGLKGPSLRSGRIKDAVDRRNAEIMAELDFTPNRIIAEIAKIAGANSADFVTIDEQGQPHIDFTNVKRRQLAAIASVENTDKGVKYKTHDKLKALDMLAKMANLYPAERTELTGADGRQGRPKAGGGGRTPRPRRSRYRGADLPPLMPPDRSDRAISISGARQILPLNLFRQIGSSWLRWDETALCCVGRTAPRSWLPRLIAWLARKASCRASWKQASICASATSLKSRDLRAAFSCKA